MRINLLPPKVKTELFEEQIRKLIIILGILILIFLFSLTLILFLVKSYISKQATSQEALVDLEKEQLEIPEIKILREKITQANQNLFKLDSFYAEQINLMEIFKKVSEALPLEMYLTYFSYQKITTQPPPSEEEYIAQVSLSGFAPYKETLLEFKKNLEKEFPNPYFPLQNWIKSADIDFQVNFKITK